MPILRNQASIGVGQTSTGFHVWRRPKAWPPVANDWTSAGTDGDHGSKGQPAMPGRMHCVADEEGVDVKRLDGASAELPLVQEASSMVDAAAGQTAAASAASPDSISRRLGVMR